MVDHEVAEILAEIKRRVSTAQPEALRVMENSARENSAPVSSVPTSNNGYAGFAVMARAWDRLPPVVTNRTGTLARIELWLKGKLRSAFRWFTWEQVNFNSATYQTLLEVVESLNAYEQHLVEMKRALDAQREELKEISATLPSLIPPLTTQIEQVDRKQLALIAQVNARLEGLSQAARDQHAETQARVAELTSESRARDEQLIDEQRVCYKQLSLELSESRVLDDRARRELEARLTKLESGK